MKKITKILFPTDISETANHALGRALRLAEEQDAELIVQHVVDDCFGPHTHWASLFDVHELQKELDFHIETEMRKDQTGSELHLLHAIETAAAMYFGIRQGTFLEGRTDTIAKMQQWAQNQLLNAIPEKYVKDPSVHRHVRVGAVSDVISSVAKEFDVDVVVVGTHQHGTAHQYLIGNTADKILRKVDAPLLTVRQ